MVRPVAARTAVVACLPWQIILDPSEDAEKAKDTKPKQKAEAGKQQNKQGSKKRHNEQIEQQDDSEDDAPERKKSSSKAAKVVAQPTKVGDSCSCLVVACLQHMFRQSNEYYYEGDLVRILLAMYAIAEFWTPAVTKAQHKQYAKIDTSAQYSGSCYHLSVCYLLSPHRLACLIHAEAQDCGRQ